MIQSFNYAVTATIKWVSFNRLRVIKDSNKQVLFILHVLAIVFMMAEADLSDVSDGSVDSLRLREAFADTDSDDSWGSGFDNDSSSSSSSDSVYEDSSSSDTGDEEPNWGDDLHTPDVHGFEQPVGPAHNVQNGSESVHF